MSVILVITPCYTHHHSIFVIIICDYYNLIIAIFSIAQFDILLCCKLGYVHADCVNFDHLF